MSHGYGEARPIGRMVPLQAPVEPPPKAACAKCGARLSRYRDWHPDPTTGAEYCWTCQQTLIADGKLRLAAFEPGDTSAERARKAATQAAA